MFQVAYGRFLRASMIAMPTMIITTIMETMPGTIYMSAADSASGVGAGVDTGPSPTVKQVDDAEGP